MVEITVKISDDDIARVLNRSKHNIACNGASGISNPIDAIVEVVKCRTGKYDHSAPESYVLCPRLTEFYTHTTVWMCHEGDRPIVDKHEKKEEYEAALEKAKICPYYNPNDK